MHRRLSRPRTKMYDSCYTMGEAYYKSALDDLDRKSGRRVSKTPTLETIEPPPQPPRGRPAPQSDMDTMVKEAAAKMAATEEEDDALAETLKRIRMARTATVAVPEESFDTAFTNRREEVKRRFSEKMLDAVGINGITEEDTVGQVVAKRRAARMIREAEEVVAPSRWTALSAIAGEDAEISAAGAAAEARALRTRARLADLEREMEDIESRSVSRQRRAAALRAMVADEESSSSHALSSSLKSSVKKMTVTTTTTKASY